MNPKTFAPLLLALSSMGMAACGGSAEPTTDAADAKTGWAGIAEKAEEGIRNEMATENLDIGREKEGLPRAALSPQGDLLIDGEKVAITDEQRELLLDFRSRLVEVAQAGAKIGIEAAAMATGAMKEAAMAALSGDKADFEARMEKESESIKVAAMALCETLPDLLESQRLAAEAIPEFRPYATMTQDDVKDCGADFAKAGEKVDAP